MINELNKLINDLDAVTIDGPSGVYIKRVIRELIKLLIDKEQKSEIK